MLNKKQALELFEREAAYFNEWEGVTVHQICQIFDIETLNESNLKPRVHYHVTRTDGQLRTVINLAGFLTVAFYANALESQLLKKNGNIVLFPRQLSPSPATRKAVRL